MTTTSAAISTAEQALRGRALRFLLVDELMNRAEMTAHHDPGWPPWVELRWLWVL